MPRPKKFRNIKGKPKSTFFKPQGIPLRILEQVNLSLDELEAIRLKNLENLDMTKGAKKMKISKSTFQRTLISAHKKIADSLIHGKAIKIHNLIDFNFSNN